MRSNMSDAAECATAMRGGSRSFHAAGRLLPRTIREAATALYAFCRAADDAIDHAPPDRRQAALADLRDRLDGIYAGLPGPDAADRAFARVVAATGMPRALPDALLEGFAWDAAGRRYDSIADLEAYAARVAGTVGAMMTVIMGVRTPATLARAAELGLAMQLTNIARDVGEDARAGRLYLPLDWLAEDGVECAAFLANPACSPAIRATIGRLLRHADGLYDHAITGVAGLPLACRPAIHAAASFYRAIGREAGRPGFDPVLARAVVPAPRKMGLAFGALGRCAADAVMPAPLRHTVRPAIAFLVEATAHAAPEHRMRAPIWRRAEDKAVWVLDLFATLEARQRAGVISFE